MSDVISKIQYFNTALQGIEIIAYHSNHELKAAELSPCLTQIRQNIQNEIEQLKALIPELRS